MRGPQDGDLSAHAATAARHRARTARLARCLAWDAQPGDIDVAEDAALRGLAWPDPPTPEGEPIPPHRAEVAEAAARLAAPLLILCARPDDEAAAAAARAALAAWPGVAPPIERALEHTRAVLQDAPPAKDPWPARRARALIHLLPPRSGRRTPSP